VAFRQRIGLAFRLFPAKLRLSLLELLGLRHVGRHRLVGRRRYVVRVVVVDSGLDPLLLGTAGQRVVIRSHRCPTVLPPITPGVLRSLERFVRHRSSSTR
jgi:hypothetical protein